MIAFLLASIVLFPAQDPELPPLNAGIIEYVESVMGTQVDRGECWDLANRALEYVDAEWDLQFKYGKEYNPRKSDVLPGDLIQFFDVKFERQITDTMYTDNGGYRIAITTSSNLMAQHTAIVYKVLGEGHFQIAHQNTEATGRTVGLGEIKLEEQVGGKMHFYRPVKN